MSTYKSVADTIKEVEFWLRLSTFLHEPLKFALLRILHNSKNDPNYDGLPEDPHLLYQELSSKHLNSIQQLKKSSILQQDQIDLILPPNDNKTDSTKFDITLICILIRNFCDRLPAPINGWNDKNPPTHDTSIAAYVIRAREWRNYIHHTEPKEIDQKTFNTKWTEGTSIVMNLGFQYNTNRLKLISLDPKHDLVLKSLKSYITILTQRQDALEDKVLAIGNDQTEQTETISNLEISQKADINKLKRQLEIISAEVKDLRVECKDNKIHGLKSGSGISFAKFILGICKNMPIDVVYSN